MNPLRTMCALALFSVPAQATPLPTCTEFLTLEQLHLQQIRVLPETGQILYANNVNIPQLTRYLVVFGWMQGQIEADAWSVNGQSQHVTTGANSI
jgi:hypothetical protein